MSDDQHEDCERLQSIGSVVLDQVQIARMERALEDLRPRDLAVFVAACHEGASHAEIAARHRFSIAKVRQIIARVLVELHQAVWPGDRS